jgi:hypothetical protein
MKKDYDSWKKGQVELPEMFLVAELTNQPIKTGISLG